MLRKLQKFISIILLITFSSTTFAAATKDCNLISKTCVDSTPCKTIAGENVCLTDVGQTCWRYESKFDCISPQSYDTCQELVAKGCAQIGSKCDTDENGKEMLGSNGLCTTFEQTYQCLVSPEVTKQIQDCSTATVCDENGNCWAKPGATDVGSFGKAASLMETLRQASVYQLDNNQIFTGDAEKCTQGFFGLKNCCGSKGGAKSNGSILNSVVSEAALSGASWLGKNAVNAGSQYVYDMMFPGGAWSSQWVGDGIGAAIQQTDYLSYALNPEIFDAASLSSFSAYGFTIGGAMPAGTLGGAVFELTPGVYFDPTSLAVTIAIQMVMQMMQCTEDEALLQMHKGANLCNYVGSYCSKKIPIIGTCIETTKSYCCYNSVLAKIISKQGKAQLGKGFGSKKNPDCSGFTPEEMQALDFSRINLDEFTRGIVTNLPNLNAVQQDQESKMTGVLKNKTNF